MLHNIQSNLSWNGLFDKRKIPTDTYLSYKKPSQWHQCFTSLWKCIKLNNILNTFNMKILEFHLAHFNMDLINCKMSMFFLNLCLTIEPLFKLDLLDWDQFHRAAYADNYSLQILAQQIWAGNQSQMVHVI